MIDERDRKVSQRYRELASEQPSRELDRNIVEAARRAADKPHAPLVTPAGRHRWYFAFAAAAILVLAVAVTIHMERERPDPEGVAVTPEASDRSGADVRDEALQSPPPEQRRDAVPAEAPAAAPAPSGSAERFDESTGAVPLSREPTTAQRSRGVAEPPERWLERIAQLRKEGRHDEADKQLADFRRRYPDYKIPEAALK